MKSTPVLIALSLTLGAALSAPAQTNPAAASSPERSAPAKAPPLQATIVNPASLPGHGLAEHDFFYAGEAKDRRAFIVKHGRVVWSYDDPAGRGEISDAMLLSNGNVLLAHQFAVKLIAPDQKVLWNHDAPPGTEIHTAMAIGTHFVVFIQNGDPALLKIVDLTTGETKREFPLPTGNPKKVHGQFRHARLTPAGTMLVAHMDYAKVCEYDATGKELWSFPADGAWGVDPLKNGNILITDRRGVREVTRRGDTAWAVAKTEITDYQPLNLQLAWRLRNGNTLINSWANQWSGVIDRANGPVQALELTPDKKVVWALRSWNEPNLGPATTIQILDEPSAPESVSFGDFK